MNIVQNLQTAFVGTPLEHITPLKGLVLEYYDSVSDQEMTSIRENLVRNLYRDNVNIGSLVGRIWLLQTLGNNQIYNTFYLTILQKYEEIVIEERTAYRTKIMIAISYSNIRAILSRLADLLPAERDLMLNGVSQIREIRKDREGNEIDTELTRHNNFYDQVTRTYPYDYATALSAAAACSNVQVLSLLTTLGAQLNQNLAKEVSYHLPLHMAIYFSQNKNVEWLIANSCDVNLKDVNGMTPLDIYNNPITKKNPDVEQLLITAGAKTAEELEPAKELQGVKK